MKNNLRTVTQLRNVKPSLSQFIFIFFTAQMIIPQPPVSGHDSPGGSDMDVSDDEGEIPNPSSVTKH